MHSTEKSRQSKGDVKSNIIGRKNEVGKTIWSRNKAVKGVVTAISHRACAVCGYGTCYIVKWDDGKITKPCTKSVGYTPEGDLLIL